MNRLTSAEIRQSFLAFFAARGHLVQPSASLVPINDPTLLFTNAGMNQFKDVFLALAPPPASRVTNSQKCMRVSGKHNDLEDVGPSPFHHTFFEMLGNWSFGDYYKNEAISWAWELLTAVWGLPKERLYATVFRDERDQIPADEEAAGYWRTKVDIDPDHILYFGRKDNFWEMGEVGPCGPCSEIHIDRGLPFCERQHVPGHKCRVNGDCSRFMELWNLVFIQYNSLGNGRLEPLPAQHVDTGAGFERLTMIMQGGESNYDTDLFAPIFLRTRELTGHDDATMRQHLIAYRVVADHARAAAFLIGDGVLPGNIGRGYVLRMVIRRAARFGRKLGFTKPFLSDIADTVIGTMGSHYRELPDRREHILHTIAQEEDRFLRTLDQGLGRLDLLLSALPGRGTQLPGVEAFDLYATYGLPLEITRDVAAEQGYHVDEQGFQQALAAHRDLSGGSMLETYGAQAAYYAELLEQLKSEGKLPEDGVEYDPYSQSQRQATVAAILRDGQRVSVASPGDQVEVVLPATPFYIEAGGQVSDTGEIASADGRPSDDQGPEALASWRIRITAMKRPVPGLIVHHGSVACGQPREADRAVAMVDEDRRIDIMRNHTATHLLHRGLRRVLGAHVQQAGSFVAPERLRFDFTHHSTLSAEELDAISRSVNEDILRNVPLQITYEPYDQALESGVTALFGEKYGDIVRVVRVGRDGQFLSQELCGGTHARATGDIGQFRILSEGSVGAGLRRIEAVTGHAADALVSHRLAVLQAAADLLECPADEVDRKAAALAEQTRATQKAMGRLQQEFARRDFEQALEQSQEINDTVVLAARVHADQIETLRQMTDWFRDRNPSGVVVLGAVVDARPQLVAAVTSDLIARGIRADQLIREIAAVIGGGGGGRPSLAQAGGRDASRLDEALSRVPMLVRQALT